MWAWRDEPSHVRHHLLDRQRHFEIVTGAGAVEHTHRREDRLYDAVVLQLTVEHPLLLGV